MTLATISANAAKDVGVNPPSTLIGSNDETAQRILAQARRELYQLRKRHDWTVLQKEHTFVLVDATASYALPADFDHFISETMWSRDDLWRLLGPTSPQQWQAVKSGAISSMPRSRWRIKRGTNSKEFFVDPTPTSADAGETFVFEYVSSYAVLDTDGSTFKGEWAADTDTSVLDEQLIELGVTWRMLKRIGLAYSEEYAEYERNVNYAIARDGGRDRLYMDGESYEPHGLVIPITGYGS